MQGFHPTSASPVLVLGLEACATTPLRLAFLMNQQNFIGGLIPFLPSVMSAEISGEHSNGAAVSGSSDSRPLDVLLQREREVDYCNYHWQIPIRQPSPFKCFHVSAFALPSPTACFQHSIRNKLVEPKSDHVPHLQSF